MKTKLKSHRGAAKRIRKTATGKLMMSRAGNRHLLSHKTSRRKRGYNLPVELHATVRKSVKRLLPYI